MKVGDKYNFKTASSEKKDGYVRGMRYAEDLFWHEFRVVLRPAYGTLLGVIRNKDFIINDTDIDMTYLSRYSLKRDVVSEMNDIYDRLIGMGLMAFDFRYRLHNPHGGQIHLRLDDFDMLLDVTTSWIDPNGKFWAFPYGHIAQGKDVIPFKRVPFRNTTMTVPHNSDKILTYLYNDWRIPVGRGANGRSRAGFKHEWNYGLLNG